MELLELIQIAHFDVSLKRSMIKSSLSQWMVNVSMLNGWRVKRYVQQGALQALFCFEMPSLSMSSRLTFVFDRIFEIMPDFVRSDFAICHLEKEVYVKSTALTIATSKAANRDNCSLFCIAILDFLTQCSRQAPSKQAACFLWLFAQVLESSRSNLDQDLHASMSSC